MPYLESSLDVLELPDLLQWLEGSKKTGMCSFSHGPKSRRLYLRDGRVIATESNEPHLLLGQFLIASGRIDSRTLRKSMMIQERTGTKLGRILIDQGEISEAELQRVVTAKAEETVYGLFEWQDGFVRFEPDRKPPADAIRVDLGNQRILFEGARRSDEMNKALQVLRSPHVVLRRTDRAPDGPTVASYMGRRLYELVDGQRTLSELILQCRSSPYLAYTFLARLVERGLLTLGEMQEDSLPEAAEARDQVDLVIPELQQLVACENYEAALDLIDRRAITHSGNALLAMLIAKAEAGFVAWAYRTKMPPDAIPHRAREYRSNLVIRRDLSPDELFLFGLIDGTWDVRSLVWISPLRKVEVVRALIKLRVLGYLDLQPLASDYAEPDERPSVSPGKQATVTQAVDGLFTKDASGDA